MPAISPAEVEHFSENSFQDELLDSINGFLKASPGVTVAICESELRSSLTPVGREDFLAEMEQVASLYRSVGWKVISATASEGRTEPCWKFNARWF